MRSIGSCARSAPAKILQDFSYDCVSHSKHHWRIGPRFATLGDEYGLNHPLTKSMTAMKKITTKPTPSPAPATKSVAAKPAAKKKTPDAPKAKPVAVTPDAPKAKPVAATPVAPAAKPVRIPAPVPAVIKAVPVPVVEKKPVGTTISAQIDVGFGNSLYVRGEGPGLSWDAGVPMECVADNLWRLTLGSSSGGLTFKFLVNDLTWSVGADYTAENGTSVSFTPEF